MDDRTHSHNVPAARDLRQRETWAEDRLWEELRGRRLAGLKFRRQHPVGPFVLDFCCVERRLAIELDGAVHAGQRERDAEREQLLVATGFRVVRFSNDEVRAQLQHVLQEIRSAALADPPSRPPGPGRTSGWG